MARPVGEKLGRAFRIAYEYVGLTQTELAERLQDRGHDKVDQPLISKWVRGVQNLPLDALPDIDAACGMPTGYVLTVAGYVDVAALGEVELPSTDAVLRHEVAGMRRELREPPPDGHRRVSGD